MQSLSNAANAASKVVFGAADSQSDQEPVSGQTGSGTVSEPYDAGNNETENARLAPTAASDTRSPLNTGTSMNQGDTGAQGALGALTSGTEDSTTGAENTFGRDRGGPDPKNEGPHATSIANKLDPRVDSDGDGKPKFGPNDLESTTAPRLGSSTDGGLSSYSPGQSGTTGDYDKSLSAGNTTGGNYTATTTDDTSGLGNQSSTYADPTDSTKTTGLTDSSLGSSGLDPTVPSTTSDPISTQQGSAQPLDEPIGGQTEAIGGEKALVEDTQAGGAAQGAAATSSTGFAADGGNFDAAKPGAGTEADRLMEQKGISHSSVPETSATSSSKADPMESSPGKPSLGDKIKEKLHIGKK